MNMVLGGAKLKVVSRFQKVLASRKGVKAPNRFSFLGKDRRCNQQGFTLVELMIAMLLLAMVSVMIYSVLNVGIRFTDKGNKRILAMERKFGMVNLIQRQIKSAVYDIRKKEILMDLNDDIFRVVTRNPFIYRSAGVVLALYRYSESDSTIYYTEKRDYWNIDYDDEYVPEFDDMIVLATEEEPLNISYEQDTSPEVSFEYRGDLYTLIPRCVDEQALAKLEDESLLQ